MRTPHGVILVTGILLLLQFLFTGCTSHVRHPVGEISHVRGNVFLGRDGLFRPRRLALHEPIYPDDVLVSAGASEAILLVENLRLTLGADSRLTIGTSSWLRFAVALEHGTIRARAESADGLFQPPVEVHLDAGTVVRARGDTLLWSQEQAAGLGPHAADTIASFGVVNVGRVGIVQLDVRGQNLPIMPQQFSVGVPGHFPIPAVPLSVATSGFMAAIHHTPPESGRAELKRSSRGTPRYATGTCHRQEGKTGVVKTPRRNGYEDVTKCLGGPSLSQRAAKRESRQGSEPNGRP
jgi:hypothetical protein